MRLLIILLCACLAGCATTTTKVFKEDLNKMERWTVDLPMHQVYRDYKEYSEEKYDLDRSGFIITGGIDVYSEYYSEEQGAELSIIVKTTFYSTPVLHFEFEKEAAGTLVNVWYFSNAWKEILNKYRALHDTHP